jgi:acyl-ACP thioesterase
VGPERDTPSVIGAELSTLSYVEHHFDELLPGQPGGRAFTQSRLPGFADCAPSGRVRLDALACWLQDVAYADVADVGLEQAAVWVVRRTRMRVNRFPRFGERFELTTFCSGLGRMWAERRTDVVPAGGSEAIVEAVSLWVHLDPERWRPMVLTEPELAVYGSAAADRKVSARLRHPAPPADSVGVPWTFRLIECDIADHVNNAAYWGPLEEELLAGPDPERLDAELEYRTPSQAGAKRVLSHGDRRWIIDADGELHASIVVRNGFGG